MNIFALSECPEQSALWLDDIRKNKMILKVRRCCPPQSEHCVQTHPYPYTVWRISTTRAVYGLGLVVAISCGLSNT